RAERPIPEAERRKIALFCNIRQERVIAALDVDTIYQVPISYHEQGFDHQVLAYFGLSPDHPPDLSRWREVVRRVRAPEGEVTIAVVGKYTSLIDSYKSLVEALAHGGIANNVKVRIKWMDSEMFETEDTLHVLEGVHGILVPGGFGERGTEGMIRAARFARERGVPYFGICFGMQMAVIEAARNLADMPNAGSSEFQRNHDPVVGLMTEWLRGNEVERRSVAGDLGGTMRLGAYPAVLHEDSRALGIYGERVILERHRHRYEVNINLKKRLEDAGLRFSGLSPDGVLPEIVEMPGHPWFIGVQFHPELKSRPFAPHPLFRDFVRGAIEQSRLV
ncbi:MAG: CTP synthase, partial [Rhodospirillaceae bacterium]